MFGVTHVMARDGYFGMIVVFSAMPVKNNLFIYDEIYSHFKVTYGLWDQVRVNGGQESNLVCHNQEYLRDQRRNLAIDPFKSAKLTDSRVNCPIKLPLRKYGTDDLIDMTEGHGRFAVSWVSCPIAKVGLQLFVEAWNHHLIPLKGQAIDLMTQNNKAIPVDQLMSKQQAVKRYRRVATRQLSIFAVDALGEYTNLQIRRETEFSRKFSFKSLFSKIQQEDVLESRFSVQVFLRMSFVLLQIEL